MTVTRDSLKTILQTVYTNTQNQSLKNKVGLFFIKYFPESVTDQQLFAYWQQLGRTADDVQFHSWVLRAIRVRWGGATAGQKTAVQNELSDILNDSNAAQELKDVINNLIAEVVNPPSDPDPESEFGSITAQNLTESNVDTIEEYWQYVPQETS